MIHLNPLKKKYSDYSLISDAVVIRRLAKRYISPDHIFIFAHGTADQFKINDITKNKLFFQLNLKEIYVTNPNTDDLKFIFYQDPTVIRNIISVQIENCSVPPTVILFMDDHRSPGFFGNFPFFDFYQIFLEVSVSSLYILNDSCHSGSIVDILDNFFRISECLDSNNFKISAYDLKFISHICKYLQPDKEVEDLNSFFEIFAKGSKYKYRTDIITTAFEAVHLFYKNELNRIYLILDHTEDQNQYQQTKQDLLKIYNTKISDIPLSQEQQLLIDQTTLLKLSNICVLTVRDLLDVLNVINTFADEYRRPNCTFQQIHDKIIQINPIYKSIQKLFKCNNQTLYGIIDSLLIQGIDFENNRFKRPSNHLIITTTHSHGISPTYGTRRISESAKIIAGAPGIAAFITEVLLFPKEDGIQISRLEELIYEDNNHILKEYAVKGNKKREKQWISFKFSQFGSSISKPLFAKIDTQIQLDTSSDAFQTKEEKILNSISFNLDIRFSDDNETPIDFDEKGKNKKELYEYSLEKYGLIIQPEEKRKKRIRFRCKKRKPSFEDNSKEIQFYKFPESENDEYYDDVSDEESNSTGDQNHKEFFYRDQIDSTNWNQRISSECITNFKKNHKSEDFITDLIDVFFIQLSSIAKHKFYLNLKCDTNYNNNIDADILIWIDYFIPAQELRYSLNQFLSVIGSYIDNFGMSINAFQNYFFHAFNAADQLVTPIYYNRETFIKDRLNKGNQSLPKIINWGYSTIYRVIRKKSE